MRILQFSRWILVFLLLTPVSPAFGDEEQEDEKKPEDLKQALAKGKGSVFFRYRYETVTDDAVGDKRAHASTLRTIVSYETLPFKGLNFYIEAENVSVIGDDQLYNNAGAGEKNNGVSDRPVVADPALTAITGAYVKAALPDTSILFGRQEINQDIQRFIGAVGWRQHHQTFDAINARNESIPNTAVSYAFLAQVNRITGNSLDMKGNLFFGDSRLGKVGNLRLYSYLLDFDEPSKRLSQQTYGGNLTGAPKLGGGFKLVYRVEFATQRDFANNPNRIDADYSHLVGGVGYKDFTFRFAREFLGGSNEQGQFNTPLATTHAFNGWADKFLVTPPNGLRDLYVAVDGRLSVLKFSLRYHDFDADTGGSDYGTEFDFQTLYTAPWGQLFGFKGAFYSADSFAADTDKLWLWMQYRF